MIKVTPKVKNILVPTVSIIAGFFSWCVDHARMELQPNRSL